MVPRILAVALLATVLTASTASAFHPEDAVDSPLLDHDDRTCRGFVDTSCYHHTSDPYLCLLYVNPPTGEGQCWMYTRY